MHLENSCQKEDLKTLRGYKGATKKFCQQIINLLEDYTF